MGEELFSETKIATLEGVREHNEHEPVELWLSPLGRVVIRAYNECRNNITDVDLADLLDWLRSGSAESIIENAQRITAICKEQERRSCPTTVQAVKAYLGFLGGLIVSTTVADGRRVASSTEAKKVFVDAA